VTVSVVRHAKAGSRHGWRDDDFLRPLSKAGRAQAKALTRWLASEPVGRIISSPYVRCVQTVEGLAKQTDLALEVAEELTEGAAFSQSLRLIEKLGQDNAVLCTHGDVIGNLLGHLDRLRVLHDEPQMPKGSTWVLELEHGDITAARYVPPPDARS
jgi:8-oxo-dGTP diphosphatase